MTLTTSFTDAKDDISVSSISSASQRSVLVIRATCKSRTPVTGGYVNAQPTLNFPCIQSPITPSLQIHESTCSAVLFLYCTSLSFKMRPLLCLQTSGNSYSVTRRHIALSVKCLYTKRMFKTKSQT